MNLHVSLGSRPPRSNAHGIPEWGAYEPPKAAHMYTHNIILKNAHGTGRRGTLTAMYTSVNDTRLTTYIHVYAVCLGE